jgi:peptidoglycan/LPS O-acetylase OafA/YrhL
MVLAPHKDRRMKMHAQGTRIRGFDGLRAIAFVLVFFSHKIKFADASPHGSVGVWAFFVLSGFLITRILAAMRTEIEAGQSSVGQGLARFYVRRTARIVPPYYVLLAVLTAVSLLLPIEAFSHANKIASATFTLNILIGYHGYWAGHFGHFWTLAVEQQFYLLFAPLVLLVPRRHTLAVCLAVLVIGLAMMIRLEMSDATAVTRYVNSLVNFALLAFGGAVGLNTHRKLPAWLAKGSVQLAMLGILIAPAFLFGHTPEWPLYGRLFCSIVAGLLLLQIVQGQGSWFVAALETAPLRGLGRISYGAYLVHEFIFVAPLLYGLDPRALGFGLPWIAATVLEFAIVVAIAAPSWLYMEKPIIVWAARMTGRQPAAAEATRGPRLQSQA